MNTRITIGREFGSGGRETGLLIARELNIPFYEKEIISRVADQGEFSRQMLEEYEEKVVFGSFFLPRPAVFSCYSHSISERIFLAQTKVIRQLAEEGPCVIVGRCADSILKGQAVRVFIHADIACRVQRKLQQETNIAEKDMERHIRSIDKKRRSYYQSFTDQMWGDSRNFHLCIDTTQIGPAGAAQVVLTYLNQRTEVCRDGLPDC